MYDNQNQTTMNTRTKQLTAKERLYTGKHHGRHIDEDDTFDDSNVRRND